MNCKGLHRVSASWAAFLLCLFPVQNKWYISSFCQAIKKRDGLRTQRGEGSKPLKCLFSFSYSYRLETFLLYLQVKLNSSNLLCNFQGQCFCGLPFIQGWQENGPCVKQGYHWMYKELGCLLFLPRLNRPPIILPDFTYDSGLNC